MLFYIYALFLYFIFNFVINEVVSRPRFCLCVCIPLELFSSGIYMSMGSVSIMAMRRLSQSLCWEWLSLDRSVYSIDCRCFLKKALYMLDYRIVEKFKEFSCHRILTYVLLTELYHILLMESILVEGFVSCIT